MKTPHPHAALIKAWADGADVEFFIDGKWLIIKHPNWDYPVEYRIKPEPKPDLIYYGTYGTAGDLFLACAVSKILCKNDKFKLTFDGETGKLKNAEVI